MNKIIPIALFIVGIILLFSGYFGLEKLPDIQRASVAKKLPFTSEAESTKKWSSSTDRGYLKMYLFNITNLNEYLNEEEDYIRVNEVGPVVYSYAPNITILNWTDHDNLIRFVKSKTYHFEPEMTKVSLNETITSVNLIAAGVVDKTSNMNFLKKLVVEPFVNQQFEKFNAGVFLTKTIDEILFAGYDISFLPQLNKEAAQKYPDNLYGLMYNKNFTHDGIWTMNTGKDNVTRLGTMEKWDDISLNNCWKTEPETCGHVVGTDGSRFHPGLDPRKDDLRVNLYSASLYRSLSMIYKRDYIFKGIKVSRYELEEDNFRLKLEHNTCYCPDSEKTILGESLCEFDGLLDISLCRKAPIIISAPHFLYGSPRLLDAVKGLRPNLNNHESYVDIDPVTGIVLKGRKRLQINAYVKKTKTGHKTKDTIVPVMWIEEGQEITDEKAVLYYSAIHGLADKASYVLIGCILIGTGLIIVALVLTSMNIIQSNEKFIVGEDGKKKSDINHNHKYHKASTTLPMDEKVKMTTTEKPASNE